MKQLGFSDGTCGTFTKSNVRIKKYKKLVIVKTSTEMHQMKYVFFEFFFRNIKEKSQKKACTDNTLRNSTFKIANDQCLGINLKGSISMNYNLVGKKSTIKVGAFRNNEKHTKINIEK